MLVEGDVEWAEVKTYGVALSMIKLSHKIHREEPCGLLVGLLITRFVLVIVFCVQNEQGRH